MKGFVRRLIDCKDYYCNIISEAKWLNSKKWAVGDLFFDYKRQVTVTEQSGNDLTDYQVLIELNSTNFDFNHAKDDGSDIRFHDGNNFLSYWIEKWDSANQEAKIWVKVPSIPASSSTSFYMYYGNSNVTSASNGKDTFEFFDDFDGTSLDTEKWGGNISDFSVSDSIIKCSNSAQWIYTLTAQVTDGEVVSKTKIDSGARGSIWGRTNQASTYIVTSVTGYSMNYRYPNGDVRARKWNDGEYVLDLTSYSHDTDWHIAKLKFNGSNITFEYEKEDGTNVYSYTTTDTDFSSGYIGLATDAIDSGSVYWDYIFIKKYTDPEPSVSIGSEETL
mgnify:CR=1 FL=1